MDCIDNMPNYLTFQQALYVLTIALKTAKYNLVFLDTELFHNVIYQLTDTKSLKGVFRDVFFKRTWILRC
jgi:hypothetical protein